MECAPSANGAIARTQALGTPVGGEVFERDELVGDLLEVEAEQVAGAPRGQPEPERVASPIATRRDPPRGGTGHRDATVTQDQVNAAVCRDGTPTPALPRERHSADPWGRRVSEYITSLSQAWSQAWSTASEHDVARRVEGPPCGLAGARPHEHVGGDHRGEVDAGQRRDVGDRHLERAESRRAVATSSVPSRVSTRVD